MHSDVPAGQSLVCLQILLKTFDILVTEIGQTTDVHVVRQVVDLHRNGQRILLYAVNEVVVVFIL